VWGKTEKQGEGGEADLIPRSDRRRGEVGCNACKAPAAGPGRRIDGLPTHAIIAGVHRWETTEEVQYR